MNTQKSAVVPQPPIAFAAKNIIQVSRFTTTDGQSEGQIWKADIKARRHGSPSALFEGIIFIEYNGIASIHGIDKEDGYPDGGFEPKEAALKQQSFIHFLREATAQDNRALGMMAALFSCHEYSNEGKATAAYIVARGTPLAMGVGYLTADDGYHLNAFDPKPDRWLENARATTPFDDM